MYHLVNFKDLRFDLQFLRKELKEKK